MEKVKIDANDINIINALCSNPMSTNMELSEAVGLVGPETLSRVKKITDNGYMERFKPLINYSKFGYKQHEVYIISCEEVELDELSKRLTNSKLVISASYMRTRKDVIDKWLYLKILGKSRSQIDEEVDRIFEGLDVFKPEPFKITTTLKDNKFLLTPEDKVM